MYGPYLERLVQKYIAQARIDELRDAREEHAALSGWFEDNEVWFDERMTHFHDWYLLDRITDNGLTPAEMFLSEEWHRLDSVEKIFFQGLTATHSSIFEFKQWDHKTIIVEDLIGGGRWEVEREMPMTGFDAGDMVSFRLIPGDDGIYFGRTIITHPREAHESIRQILDLCRSRREMEWSLAGKLLKMRLKFDRYPNMKLKHVYRDPRLPIL